MLRCPLMRFCDRKREPSSYRWVEKRGGRLNSVKVTYVQGFGLTGVCSVSLGLTCRRRLRRGDEQATALVLRVLRDNESLGVVCVYHCLQQVGPNRTLGNLVLWATYGPQDPSDDDPYWCS